MLIEFKETTKFNPTEWFEMHFSNHDIGLGIYYPTKELHDYIVSTNDLSVNKNGIDIEAEACANITSQLIAQFDVLGFDRGRTRLEVALALGAINSKLFRKYDVYFR